MEGKLSVTEFESFLEETCDSLRGERTVEEFEEYVIGIVFLKRLNDRFNMERELNQRKFREKGFSEAEIEDRLEKRESYRLFVPKVARWDVVKQEQHDLTSYLANAFKEIDAQNRGCLGLLNTIDFNKTDNTGKKFITHEDLVELMKRFEKLELTDDHLAF